MFSARRGGVVRKSNYRHMSGDLWPKSQSHENIQLGIGQSLSDYIQTDGIHFALPYNMPGGVLAYRRVNDFGKWPSDLDQLDNQFITAHQKNISDFKFSPFELFDSNNETGNTQYSLLATTSADECVKLWKIPNRENEGTYYKLQEPDSVLCRTDKSYGVVHNIRFHPRIQNLLMTTQTSLVRFWDQTVADSILDIHLEDNMSILSADFFSNQPYLLAASCSDRSIRIWDVRTPEKPISINPNVHSSGGKPFTVKCINKNKKPIIFSVGFSKTGSREFATFDLRKGSVTQESDYLQRTTIDQISSVIAPFWDEDIAVMYLAGKGDSNIRYYELSDSDQFEYLTEFTPDTTEPPASKPQKSIDIFPKTSCDVNKFEMSRFLKLTNDNCVKVISFKVSRHKNIAHYFHEDIFPNTWNRKPVTDKPSEWKAGKMKEKLLKREIGFKSLKPEEKISIYDVPEDQGGKERPEPDEEEMTLEELKEYQEKKLQLNSPSLTPSSPMQENQATPSSPVSPVSGYPTFLPSSAVTEGSANKSEEEEHVEEEEEEIIHETVTTTVTTERQLNFMLVAKVVAGSVAGLGLALLIKGKFLLYYILLAVPILVIFFKFYAYQMVASEKKNVSQQVTRVKKPVVVKKKTQHKKGAPAPITTSRSSPSDIDNSTPRSSITTPREFTARFETTKELSSLLDKCIVTIKDLKRRAHEQDESCAAREIDIVNVRKAQQPLLFYVRGRMVKRVSLIPTHHSSMFHLKNCSFVLDFGNNIFQYNTSDANRFVKAYAQDIAQEIKAKERNGLAQVMIYDQGKRPDRDLEKRFEPMFWKVLGLKDEQHFLQAQQQHLDEIGQKARDQLLHKLNQQEDDQYCRSIDKNMNIYRVNTELLKYEEEQSVLRTKQKIPDPETPDQWIERVKSSILININWEKDKIQPSHKVLSPDSCYIIETVYPTSEVFCWQGNKSDMSSRTWALTLARKIAHLRTLKENSATCVFKKPKSTESFATFTRVIESGEHVLFKKKFSDFPGLLLIQTAPPKQSAANVALKKEQEEIDIKALVNNKKVLSVAKASAAQELYNEETKMWRIQQYDKAVYSDMGHFYTMDAYILLHSYQKIKNGKPCHTIYFWQGRDIKKAERGTSAYKAVEINDMISGKDGDNAPDGGLVEKQVREVQTLESASFIRLFPDGFIVYRGYYHARDEQQKQKNVFLFDVRATDDHVVHFTECDLISSTYLSGGNCAVLVDISGNTVYLWVGAGANEKQVQNSQKLISSKLVPHLKMTNPTITIVKEGSESSAFWKYFIDGASSFVKQNPVSQRGRLFEITEETGTITCTECFPLSQETLQSEKIYLVDASATSNMIFLWIGKASSVSVKKYSSNLASNYGKYLKVPESGQYVVEELFEPVEFRLLFDAWTEQSAAAKDRSTAWIYSEESSGSSTLKKLGDYHTRLTKVSSCRTVADMNDSFAQKYYTYEQLSVADRSLLPEGIDSTVIENYLNDQEFNQVFAMDRESFQKLPAWKKQQLKKKANLF